MKPPALLLFVFLTGCATESTQDALQRHASVCIERLGFQGVTRGNSTPAQDQAMDQCMRAEIASDGDSGRLLQSIANGIKRPTVTDCRPTGGGAVQCVTR